MIGKAVIMVERLKCQRAPNDLYFSIRLCAKSSRVVKKFTDNGGSPGGKRGGKRGQISQYGSFLRPAMLVPGSALSIPCQGRVWAIRQIGPRI